MTEHPFDDSSDESPGGDESNVQLATPFNGDSMPTQEFKPPGNGSPINGTVSFPVQDMISGHDDVVPDVVESTETESASDEHHAAAAATVETEAQIDVIASSDVAGCDIEGPCEVDQGQGPGSDPVDPPNMNAPSAHWLDGRKSLAPGDFVSRDVWAAMFSQFLDNALVSAAGEGVKSKDKTCAEFLARCSLFFDAMPAGTADESKSIEEAEPALTVTRAFFESFAAKEEKSWNDLTSTMSSMSISAHELYGKFCPINLMKVSTMLAERRNKTESLDGKDVIVLVGATGAGKTTTLLWLAGTSFEEVELDYCDHYRPIITDCQSSAHLDIFQVSPDSKSVTTEMRSIEVEALGRSITICDTPGFGDTGGPEVDIVNSYILVEQLRRCRSVKPVVVIPRSTMDDRFAGFLSIVKFVAHMAGGRSGADLSAYDYVFTKFSEKEARFVPGKIRQFLTDRQEELQEDQLMHRIVRAMLAKVEHQTIAIRPTDSTAVEVLSALYHANCDHIIADPALYFERFVSHDMYHQLAHQRTALLKSFDFAIAHRNVLDAKYRAEQVKVLATVVGVEPRSIVSLVEHAKAQLASVLQAYCDMKFDLDALRQSANAVASSGTILLMFEAMATKYSLDVSPSRLWIAAIDPAGISLSASVDRIAKTPIKKLQKSDMEEAAADVAKAALLSEAFGAFEEFRRVTAIKGDVLSKARVLAGRVGKSLLDKGSKLILRLEEYERRRQMLFGFKTTLEICAVETAWIETVLLQSKEKLDTEARRAHDKLQATAAAMRAAVWEEEKTVRSSRLETNFWAKSYKFVLSLSGIDTKSLVGCEQFAQGQWSLSSFEDAYRSFVVMMSTKCLECGKAVQELHHPQDLGTAQDRLEALSRALVVLETLCRDSFHLSANINIIIASVESDLKVARELFLLSKGRLNDQLANIESNVKTALSNASAFLDKIRIADLSMLPDLLVALAKADSYPSWKLPEEFLSQRIKRFFTWQSDPRDALEQTKSKILSILQRKIAKCAKTLLALSQSVAPKPLQYVSALLSTHLGAFDLCTAFILVSYKCPELYDALVFGMVDVEYLPLALSDCLARAWEFSEAEVDGTSKLRCAKLLSLWQNASAATDRVRMVGLSATESSETVPHSFTRSLGYSVLLEKAINATRQLAHRLSHMNFEQMYFTANDLDRGAFYDSLILDVLAGQEILELRSHVQAAELEAVFDSARNAVTREVRRLGDRLLDRLQEFCLSDIKSGSHVETMLLNLETICTRFKGIDNVAAGEAEECISTATAQFSRHMESSCSVPAPNAEQCVVKLITLKKVGRFISRWRVGTNRVIDVYMNRSARTAESPSRFLLEIHTVLQQCTGDDAPYARQLLSEHKALEGGANVLFNEQTSRQGIDYVVESLDLEPTAKVMLCDMYASFTVSFNALVTAGLPALRQLSTKDANFDTIVKATHEIVQDLNLHFSEQAVLLSSHIFALWTLQKGNPFVAADGATVADVGQFLMKPHAAQVVAVWLSIGALGGQFQSLRSRMTEVKTGEGKSIVLGVICTILALQGCEVDCCCYSSYLSNRDEEDFAALFDAFGVRQFISYDTVDNLAVRMNAQDNSDGMVRDAVFDNWDEDAASESDDHGSASRLKVLLFDEVDFFFKNGFQGRTRGLLTEIDGTAEVVKYIWLNRTAMSTSTVRQTSAYVSFMTSVSPDMRPLVARKIDRMVKSCRNVVKGTYTDYVIFQDRISYKRFDGLLTNSYYGETLFLYMKEHELGNITDATLRRELDKPLMLSVGKTAYQEMAFHFDLVLGVSGTLTSMSKTEIELLKNQVGVYEMQSIPSIYGESKLSFKSDDPLDVKLCPSELDHHARILHEIFSRQNSSDSTTSRCVLVFFSCKEAMTEFYESILVQHYKSKMRTVTEVASPHEKDAAFVNAMEAGAITLLIREFGRGTDFKCYDKRILDVGGVHVIQTFLSTDLCEEVQIKGRTARQGAVGSYSLILRAEDVAKALRIDCSNLDRFDARELYKYLDDRRREVYDISTSGTSDGRALELHYKSIAMKHAMKTRTRRAEVVSFLGELNGAGSSGAFADYLKIKQRILEERDARLAKFMQAARDDRQTVEKLLLAYYDNPSSSIDLTRLMDSNATHYDVLHIERDATHAQILSGFRRLALLVHPDKCHLDDAAAMFRRITEARAVLMDTGKRRRYDAETFMDEDEPAADENDVKMGDGNGSDEAQ